MRKGIGENIMLNNLAKSMVELGIEEIGNLVQFLLKWRMKR